jgi:hypothetical protein
MIYPSPKPAVTADQMAIPAVPIAINGRLTQQWEIINRPVNPAVRVPYEMLHSMLLVSPAYVGFVTRASAPGAPPAMGIAYSALADALTTARLVKPNIPILQASFGNVIAVGGFSAPELVSIQTLLVTAGLNSIFTIPNP